MESLSSRRGRGREHALIAAGLAAGAALVWAGATVQDGLRTAGDVAVARLSGAVADTVVAEWERMLREPNEPIEPAGESFHWDADEPRIEPLALRELLPEPGRPSVFETLLAEAERRELVEDDLAGALELVLEALSKDPEAPEGWLRAMQLSVKLGRRETADEYWEHLRGLDLVKAREGIPYRLLGWLARPREWRGDEPAPVTYSELGRLFVEDDRLVLGPPSDPTPHFEIAAMLQVVADREGEPIASVVMEPFMRPFLEERMTSKLDELVQLPEVPHDGRWHFLELAGRPFAARVTDFWTMGFFHSIESLAHALAGSLPAGFALDFAGSNEALGVSLRPRVRLPDSPYAFTLRHPDPAGLGRAEASRLKILRGALFSLALACAAGGFLFARVLARQRKLAELKSAFVAGVSHDLRTPLASILLLAENLESGVAGDADRARYHGALRKEATRLRRLVDDVLDFSRLERGEAVRLEREGLDLARFASELEADCRARVEAEGRAFACERGALPKSASLDAHAVRRALENLLDNALKHGGGAVRLILTSAGDRLVLAVADEGPGVPAAERERVFEPFERLDGVNGANGHTGGTGLGLAIVRSIARAHGGEARVRAGEDGKGAVFELDLPLEESPA